ncbi:hypothetical protein IEQ34_015292 [Dendrobium chrysotoxum]|uniref:Uncharacterized protein n=1 Tax=Dendrobium chrysotoxum TaxID=161865 RepID=A0AAV7GGA9_DENCH|nr:hypothetical protein IEQ34_015292 [Dendrobium chrysotoxum]
MGEGSAAKPRKLCPYTPENTLSLSDSAKSHPNPCFFRVSRDWASEIRQWFRLWVLREIDTVGLLS